MHKRNFSLTTGECLNDDSYGVVTFDVKIDGDDLLLLLPEPEDLDAVIGTSKWMVRQATAELIDRGATEESSVEIVGPTESVEAASVAVGEGFPGSSCSGGKLDW